MRSNSIICGIAGIALITAVLAVGAAQYLGRRQRTQELWSLLGRRDNRRARQLCAGGVDANFRNHGMSVLSWAAIAGDEPVVHRLLDLGADVNYVDPDGATPLIYAAGAKAPAVVRLFLAAGADANSPDRYGQTALMAAAEGGDVETVEMLLKAGADPTVADYQGNTAASVARGRGFSKLGSLLEKGPRAGLNDR